MSEPPEPTYNPQTLHETFADPASAQARADEVRGEITKADDETGELLARGDLVDILRVLGKDDDALTEAIRAVDRAELVGTAAQQHVARLRLARVRQWRGEFAESNLLFTELGHAGSQFGPVIYAFTEQYAGENAFDQGHYGEAHDHFAEALRVRRELSLPDDQVAISEVALTAADLRRAAT